MRSRNTFSIGKPDAEGCMLRWSFTFIVIAPMAAVFGFGGNDVGAAAVEKVLFVTLLIMAIIHF
jgi:uncharacterized membrane protein YtjA (UPF0391 family)